MLDDQLITTTSIDQQALERKVVNLLDELGQPGTDEFDQELFLDRKRHAKYLYGGLGELPSGFSSLDASRTWICYWILHGLALLDQPLPDAPDRASIIAFLASCQHPEGGFGGGPFQLPHLATTYAAVSALVTLGCPEALRVINREALFQYLLRMCVPGERGGGMTMHQGGEVDVRGCYCALAACHMLGLDKEKLAEACALSQFVAACQSHEGGIGGEPGNEAHGGYAFCGYAALALAGLTSAVDQEQLLQWAVRMQGSLEGGFMGRTCKLVDGCYSFWQGGVFPILQQQLPLSTISAPANNTAVDSESFKKTASRLVVELAPDSATVSFVANLPEVPPGAVAEQCIAAIQHQMQASLVESKAQLASGEASQPAQQRVTAALRRLSELEQTLEVAQEHLACTQSAAYDLVERHLANVDRTSSDNRRDRRELRENTLYDAGALQLWLLGLCQGIRGGLRDKPGKPVDYYHTCYCLSGLSSSQHASGLVLGGQQNALQRAHPLCNVVETKVAAAVEYFKTQ